MKVTVFHNIAKDDLGRPLGFFGYETGHQMVQVFTFDADTSGHLAAAERAFHLFNVGDDPSYGIPSNIAVEYRARGLRSLSVGDVVVINDTTAYACASMGWTEIPDFAPRPVRRTADC